MSRFSGFRLYKFSIYAGFKKRNRTAAKNCIIFILNVSIVFLSACSQSLPQKVPSPILTETISKRDSAIVDSAKIVQKKDWVEETLQRLTLEEKIAQLFFVWTKSDYMAKDSPRWQELERLVVQKKIGGFIFSVGSVYEYPIQINTLQKFSDVPLLIACDFEHGAGMRIDRATTFPHAMALGATRDARLAYEMGKATAREARALGVHQNYAPDIDVNVNPKNPVINIRAFSDDVNLVSTMGASFIRGTQDAGVLATAKHFPGHGDTDIDTHLELPSVTFNKQRFDSLELRPFRSAIDAAVKSVMVGHIAATAFDTIPKLPATVSENIITKLLKNELGFDGLVVTDAMVMNGISKQFESGDASVRALKAGNDLLLMTPNVDTAITAVANAVKRGEISEERINISVRKLLQAKRWCGLDTNRFVDVGNVAAIVNSREHQQLAKEIARKSVTVLGNKNKILPFIHIEKKKILAISFADSENPSEGKNLFGEIKKRHEHTAFAKIDMRSNQMEYDDVFEKAKKADILLLQLYYFTRSGENTGFIPKKVSEYIHQLLALKKPTVAISLGNPYVVMEFPSIENYLCTYSACDASEEAATEILFNEQPACGKLPITIPGVFKFGDCVEYGEAVLHEGSCNDVGVDSVKLAKVNEVIETAVRDSAFPGAVLLVAKDGVIIHNTAYGKFDYTSNAQPVTTNSIFDLASVTKVTATTSAVMRLLDEEKIHLNDLVVHYIPSFSKNGKEKITIYNLLVHNSGLPGWRKFYTFCDSAQCVLDSIFASGLHYHTGDSTVYSDLGFITLGKIVEKVSGLTLDKYVDSVFFKPLGMKNTMYNPMQNILPPQNIWKHVVPTEVDSFWKKTFVPVHGRVHDENATVLGGVSGHAGLFSTASDLAILLQMELNGGIYNGKRYLKKETIDLFTTRQSKESSRAIGWDTKSSANSFSGTLTSERTFLHTGFTGTSVVVDPAKNVIIIFLTNRVHPTRSNLKIAKVRPAVHDAVMRAMK